MARATRISSLNLPSPSEIDDRLALLALLGALQRAEGQWWERARSLRSDLIAYFYANGQGDGAIFIRKGSRALIKIFEHEVVWGAEEIDTTSLPPQERFLSRLCAEFTKPSYEALRRVPPAYHSILNDVARLPEGDLDRTSFCCWWNELRKEWNHGCSAARAKRGIALVRDDIAPNPSAAIRFFASSIASAPFEAEVAINLIRKRVIPRSSLSMLGDGISERSLLRELKKLGVKVAPDGKRTPIRANIGVNHESSSHSKSASDQIALTAPTESPTPDPTSTILDQLRDRNLKDSDFHAAVKSALQHPPLFSYLVYEPEDVLNILSRSRTVLSDRLFGKLCDLLRSPSEENRFQTDAEECSRALVLAAISEIKDTGVPAQRKTAIELLRESVRLLNSADADEDEEDGYVTSRPQLRKRAREIEKKLIAIDSDE